MFNLYYDNKLFLLKRLIISKQVKFIYKAFKDILSIYFSTEEIVEKKIKYLLERDGVPIYLNIHPERWASGWWDGIWCGLMDFMADMIKCTLRRNRYDF